LQKNTKKHDLPSHCNTCVVANLAPLKLSQLTCYHQMAISPQIQTALH